MGSNGVLKAIRGVYEPLVIRKYAKLDSKEDFGRNLSPIFCIGCWLLFYLDEHEIKFRFFRILITLSITINCFSVHCHSYSNEYVIISGFLLAPNSFANFFSTLQWVWGCKANSGDVLLHQVAFYCHTHQESLLQFYYHVFKIGKLLNYTSMEQQISYAVVTTYVYSKFSQYNGQTVMKILPLRVFHFSYGNN